MVHNTPSPPNAPSSANPTSPTSLCASLLLHPIGCGKARSVGQASTPDADFIGVAFRCQPRATQLIDRMMSVQLKGRRIEEGDFDLDPLGPCGLPETLGTLCIKYVTTQRSPSTLLRDSLPLLAIKRHDKGTQPISMISRERPQLTSGRALLIVKKFFSHWS